MFQYQASKNLLQGKIILVTGAGDGIGKAAALSYAEHGATVILLGRTISKLEKVYDEIENNNWPQPAIIPLNLDGAVEKDYEEVAISIENAFGRLDGILHNASILGSLTSIDQYEVSVWEKVMRINVNSAFMLTKSFLHLLKAASSPSIIFTTSSVGRKGRAFWGEYAFSKFATEGLMQTMADEFGHTSIRTNCINPGGTKTKMRSKAYPAEDVSKLKTPEQIMPSYVYLMSDASKSVNGESLDAQPK